MGCFYLKPTIDNSQKISLLGTHQAMKNINNCVKLKILYSVRGNWFSVGGNWFSVWRNWFSLRGNWISERGNRISVIGNWFSVRGNWISFGGNWISFGGNRPANGIVIWSRAIY